MNNEENDNVIAFKIVLVGPQDAKKSAIAKALKFKFCDEDCQPIIGAGYIPYRTSYDKNHIELQNWDTAGMERYKSLGSIYYRDARSCIIAYRQKNTQSPDDLQVWLDSFRANVKKPCYIVVASNVDNSNPSEVHDEVIKRWCDENHLDRFFVSPFFNQFLIYSCFFWNLRVSYLLTFFKLNF